MEEVKLVGIVLIILSSSLLGFYYAAAPKRRIADLLELRRALGILKAEISYGLTVFPEAAANIAERTKSPIKDIFMDMHETLKENRLEMESLFDIWCSSFQKYEKRSHFSKEDISAFSSLGQTIGYLDKKMQTSAIDMTDVYITDKVDELNKKNEKTSRMYRSIGILGGILITIVLL